MKISCLGPSTWGKVQKSPEELPLLTRVGSWLVYALMLAPSVVLHALVHVLADLGILDRGLEALLAVADGLAAHHFAFVGASMI